MPFAPLPIPDDANPYEVSDRRAIYESPWIRVREDRFVHRRGAQGAYSVCGFRNTACGVLALDAEDRVVLVGQWRYPLERYSWEIPEGGGREDESPFQAMQRELREEAQLEARVWEPMAFFHTSNSATDEEAFLFLARDLEDAHGETDADEELRLHREPFEDCLRRVQRGEITDGLTVVAITALQARRSGLAEPMDSSLAERFFQRPDQHPSQGRARWRELA